jgi:hypothetical protein
MRLLGGSYSATIEKLVRRLWQKDATKTNRPARLIRKAAKLLWRCDPIVPRHDPPKVDVVEFPDVHAYRRKFFLDFKEFADAMNSWLASFGNQLAPGRLRLQDLPEYEVGRIVPSPGRAALGRCFRLYYNQYPVGRLEIEPEFGYTTETPHVRTDVEIDMARHLGYHELSNFLREIAAT